MREKDIEELTLKNRKMPSSVHIHFCANLERDRLKRERERKRMREKDIEELTLTNLKMPAAVRIHLCTDLASSMSGSSLAASLAACFVYQRARFTAIHTCSKTASFDVLKKKIKQYIAEISEINL